MLQRSLKIAKEIGDKDGEVKACGILGNVYYRLGDVEKAIDYHESDLKIAKELGDKAGEGGTYDNLENSYFWQGNFQKAMICYYLSQNIANEVAGREREGRAYFRLGLCFESLGCLDDAEDCFQSSAEAFNDVRDRLQDKDMWKISYSNKVEQAYSALVRVLLKRGKIIEALIAADQGRAQALKDLIKSKYGMKATYRGSRSQEQTIFDVHSVTIQQTQLL